MRRRKTNPSLLLVPLMLMFLSSGCIRTPPVKNPPFSHPFSRELALERLESLTRIQTLTGSVRLSGSIEKDDTIKKPPFAISGALIMKRPKIFLKGSKLGFSLFEMVSDGKQYQIYARDELYVGGMEEGPPYKSFSHLKPTEDRLIGIRPGKLQEALLVDVSQLLANPSVTALPGYETVFEANRARHCFVIDFIDVSSVKVPRRLQKFYFDLATAEVDLWRRKTYAPDGKEEVDARYTEYEPDSSASLRYPSTIEVYFFATKATVKIELKPNEMNFNGRDHETGEIREVSEQRFRFDTHSDAKKTFKFEPLESGTVSQQR